MFLKQLHDMLLPKSCCCCGKRLTDDEELVCPDCKHALPIEASFDWEFNRRKIAWHEHSCVLRVGALARYERGNVASQLVRALKFHHHYELGEWMGHTSVQLLKETGLFEGVEMLVPIPLTKKRFLTRGFNQAETIARGMADELKISMRTDVLQRMGYRESQTHFMTNQRAANAQGNFKLINQEGLQGRHIMLVDDVITTGATMLNAISAMENIPEVRLSAFAWAWAYMPAPVHI